MIWIETTLHLVHDSGVSLGCLSQVYMFSWWLEDVGCPHSHVWKLAGYWPGVG